MLAVDSSDEAEEIEKESVPKAKKGKSNKLQDSDDQPLPVGGKTKKRKGKKKDNEDEDIDKMLEELKLEYAGMKKPEEEKPQPTTDNAVQNEKKKSRKAKEVKEPAVPVVLDDVHNEDPAQGDAELSQATASEEKKKKKKKTKQESAEGTGETTDEPKTAPKKKEKKGEVRSTTGPGRKAIAELKEHLKKIKVLRAFFPSSTEVHCSKVQFVGRRGTYSTRGRRSTKKGGGGRTEKVIRSSLQLKSCAFTTLYSTCRQELERIAEEKREARKQREREKRERLKVFRLSIFSTNFNSK